MLQILIWALVAYCVYKIVFRFLIPLFIVGRRMKRQVREFQRMATGQYQESSQKDNVQQPERASKMQPKPKAGDYIDFEEVK